MPGSQTAINLQRLTLYLYYIFLCYSTRSTGKNVTSQSNIISSVITKMYYIYQHIFASHLFLQCLQMNEDICKDLSSQEQLLIKYWTSVQWIDSAKICRRNIGQENLENYFTELIRSIVFGLWILRYETIGLFSTWV